MEQQLLEALSKLSTANLLILVAGYSIGKITAYLTAATKRSCKSRIMLLELEVKSLRKDLEHATTGRSKVE